MKIEKFLFAENPLIESDSQYILHTRAPRCLMQIIHTDFEKANQDGDLPSITFLYTNPESLNELITIAVIDLYDQPERLDGLLERAKDWYVQCLKTWDGPGGFPQLLKDYTPAVPGLKIIFAKTRNRWGFIYKGIAKSFTNEFEMDKFLETKFDITPEHLDKGILNTLP